MYSVKDLNSGVCTHDEYYAQFVESGNAKHLILETWSVEELKEAYEKDEYLNNLPSRFVGKYLESGQAKIEDLTRFLSHDPFNMYGDYNTLSKKVCVLKTAARMIVKENQ